MEVGFWMEIVERNAPYKIGDRTEASDRTIYSTAVFAAQMIRGVGFPLVLQPTLQIYGERGRSHLKSIKIRSGNDWVGV